MVCGSRLAGEPDTAMGTRTFELVVCRIAEPWQTVGCNFEPDQPARMDGHDPYAYLKDVLTRSARYRAFNKHSSPASFKDVTSKWIF